MPILPADCILQTCTNTQVNARSKTCMVQFGFPDYLKVYLAVSAGSVPVESMFSTAGNMLNSTRSSMAPYKVVN